MIINDIPYRRARLIATYMHLYISTPPTQIPHIHMYVSSMGCPATELTNGNLASQAPNQAKSLCAGYAPTMRGIQNQKTEFTSGAPQGNYSRIAASGSLSQPSKLLE